MPETRAPLEPLATPTARRHPSRRSVLAAGIAAGLAAPAIAAPPRAVARTPRAGAKPRNVILMVSDGMSTGSLTLADELHRLQHGGAPSRWVSLWNKPGVRRAVQRTNSADGLVTDSAAAASAWSIAEKTDNGSVCITPDRRQPEPILVRAKDAGRATALVTTTRLTHATPAAFIANAPRRSLEDDIARQLVERSVDIALGGGRRHFPEDLLAKHRLQLVRTTAELEAAEPGDEPLLGLFRNGHLRYELDRRSFFAEREPDLAHMTRVALRHLDAKDQPFVMQVEGGRIDHACHGNDAGGMLYDQLAFDAAVGVVEDWAAERGDTLVIVTTDHGNANPGQTFYGPAGVQAFARTLAFQHSFDWIFDQVNQSAERGGDRREAIHEHVRTATGIELDEHETEAVDRAMDGERVSPFRLMNAPWCALGSALANHTGVAFLSPNHTADLVEVTAFGPGADDIPAYLDNHELGAILNRVATGVTAR